VVCIGTLVTVNQFKGMSGYGAAKLVTVKF
jgi:hypothetical protein